MRTLAIAALCLLGAALTPSGASAAVFPNLDGLLETAPTLEVENVDWRRYRHCHRLRPGWSLWHGPGVRRRIIVRGGCPRPRYLYREPGVEFRFRVDRDRDRDRFRFDRDRDRFRFDRDRDRDRDRVRLRRDRDDRDSRPRARRDGDGDGAVELRRLPPRGGRDRDGGGAVETRRPRPGEGGED